MSGKGRDGHIAGPTCQTNIVSAAGRWFYRGIGVASRLGNRMHL